MGKNRRTKPWLWRWRRNELRRRSDVIEAWIVLSAWVLAVIGGAMIASVAAQAVVTAVDAQYADRHAVRAVLTADAPTSRPMAEGVRSDLVRAPVRWTAQDGRTRTGAAQVTAGAEAGAQVRLWADRNDELAPAPLTAGEAVLQACLAGGLAALGTGGVVLLGSRAVRAQLDRIRMRQWEREWEQIGPAWRRKTQ
jgi:hypothetical protein